MLAYPGRSANLNHYQGQSRPGDDEMTHNDEPMRFFIRSPRLGCIAQFRFAEDASVYLTGLAETEGGAEDWEFYDRTVLLGSANEVRDWTVTEIAHRKAVAA